MALGNPPSGNTFVGRWPGAYSTLKKTNLKPGANSVNVKWLQQALNHFFGGRTHEFGYKGTVPLLVVDGDYGIRTEGVVRALQTKFSRHYAFDSRATVDGWVGPFTWARINEGVLGAKWLTAP